MAAHGLKRLLLAGRLVHPFPSTLDAVATAAIAWVAGAGVSVAGRLALGMLLIQFGIGAANDVADRALDARTRPDKPVAAGIVGVGVAAGVAVTAMAAGLIFAVWVRPEALVIALLGISTGLAYDLRLKETWLAWLAFAVGVGLLPVYALWGATGCAAPSYGVIFGLAIAGGGSLALANALSDAAADEAAGLATIATVLGRRRTLLVGAGLLLAVQVTAAVSAFWLAAPGLGTAIFLAFLAGVTISWTGVGVGVALPRRAPRAGWEIQAIGLALTGVAWLAALQAAGALRSC